VTATYVPDRGELIWVDLSPVAGHEQSGRRPVLVLSPKIYNKKTGLCVVCAATRQRKGYAFEVVADTKPGQESVILADHVRNIDWRARRAEKYGRLPKAIVEDVLAKLSALLFPESDG